MRGINKAIVIGHLGNDPEVKYTASGKAVATLSVATNENWTNKDGQKEERTEWHRVVVWGKQAENCGEYLKKGRQVYIEGRIQTRSWQDKDGNKKYTTEIVANNVQFLGERSTKTGTADVPEMPKTFNEETPQAETTNNNQIDPDSDIPF